jgi:ATP-binding cassette subfamily B protein
MKILLHYIKPYRWLVVLALALAAINQVFSLFSPAIAGNILDLFVTHPHTLSDKHTQRTLNEYLFGNALVKGAVYFLLLLIGTAMISRIAKAFQDYTTNVIIQKFSKIWCDHFY